MREERVMRTCIAAAVLAGTFVLLYAGATEVAAQIGACSVATTSVSFGSYDPYASGPLDGQGTIQYTCFGLMRTVRVSISTGGSGNFSRRMSGPGSPLNYNLYLDATHQTIWGDGSSGTQPLVQRNIIIYANYTATVYGRIPPLQNVGLGTYSDSLVVTAEW
jgi:spore coat protein U-like protein